MYTFCKNQNNYNFYNDKYKINVSVPNYTSSYHYEGPCARKRPLALLRRRGLHLSHINPKVLHNSLTECDACAGLPILPVRLVGIKANFIWLQVLFCVAFAGSLDSFKEKGNCLARAAEGAILSVFLSISIEQLGEGTFNF